MTTRTIVALLGLLAMPASGWAKGETTKIEINGADLAAPIEIIDPNVATRISIWNGPMVSSCDSRGHCTAHIDPEKTHAFVDWPKEMTDEPSSALERYVVALHIAGREALPRRSQREYRFIYVMRPDSGYVFLPLPSDKELGNELISNGVEGNWFYSSARWEALVRPFIEKGARKLCDNCPLR